MILKCSDGKSYDIDIRNGKKKYICPACVDNRTKKKDTALSISVTSDGTVGHCHYCNNNFYELKNSDLIIKDYSKCKIPQTKLSANVIEYFAKRKISESSLNYLKVTSGNEYMPQVEKETNCIKFNFYKGDEIINIKFRDNNKNFKFVKDCEVTFYNYNAIFDNKDIIITEGEIDALSFIEAGIYNVVSLPNGCKNVRFIEDYIFDLEKVENFYLCMDKDAGGLSARNELIGRLGIHKCHIINTYDCKDANAYLIKYGKIKLQEAYKNAEKLLSDNDSFDFDEYLKQAEISLNTELKQANIIFGVEKFDRKIEIFSEGNLSGTTGLPKSRKTTAILIICEILLSKKYPGYISNVDKGIIIFDTEQTKYHSKRFIERLNSLAPIDKFKMFNIRAYDKQTRFKIVCKYIEQNAPSLVIIDNLRDIMVDFNDNKESDFVITTLTNLSETTGTHIHCILHTNKGDNNARGHLGSELAQKSENVFLVTTDDIESVTTIKQKYTRNELIDEIKFEYVDGLPQLHMDKNMSECPKVEFKTNIDFTKPSTDDEPF